MKFPILHQVNYPNFEEKKIRENNLSPFFSVSGIGNIQDEKDMIKVYESYVECGKITC